MADSENCRVRRVTPEGTITTVAGTGECGTGGDDGPAISARLDRPRGVAVRDSTLYIADSYSGRVRAVDLVAGTITTVAGGGPCCDPGDGGSAAGAYLPFAEKIALGPGGDLYVTDGIYAVRRVDPSGIISTVAGNFDPNALCPDGSDSTECGFDHPTEAIPFGDDLYVAETWGLRHIDLG